MRSFKLRMAENADMFIMIGHWIQDALEENSGYPSDANIEKVLKINRELMREFEDKNRKNNG